jgi:hypothetical protein
MRAETFFEFLRGTLPPEDKREAKHKEERINI